MSQTPVPSMAERVDEERDASRGAGDPATPAMIHAETKNDETSPGSASQGTLRSVRCRGPAQVTVDRLERALVAAGIKVFARIDHAGEARAVGLSMRPAIVLIFGNPRVGTPLMILRPTVALDLPLKALVWDDETGGTWLTYSAPHVLEQRHGLEAGLASSLVPALQLIERTCTAWR